MADIKKHILNRLQTSGLTPKDLEKPGAHVMITDGQDLHVLVKKTDHTKAIDRMEAEIPGYRGELGVQKDEAIDFGDLGEWHDFVVTGLGDEALKALAEKSAELRIFSADKGEPGGAFFTSVDLAFAISEVIDRGVLAVRPVPPGERDGKQFVEVSSGQRRVIHQLLGRWVDDTVPADTLLKAAEAWRGLQAEVYDTGLIGALTLGLAPHRADAPRPDAVEAPKAGAHGLSGDTIAYLEEAGMELPKGKPTLAWTEASIDGLPRDVPESVALELREVLGRLYDAREQAGDDMFAADAGAAKPVAEELVHQGQRALSLSKKRRLSQIEKGTEGLGVPAATQKKLAEALAAALEPRKKPSLILVAGPRGSAAEPVLELASSIVGKNPLRIMGGDLAEPGWAVLFGHNRGFPTEGDAWLSSANLAQHRETAADHAPVVIENLAAAGSSVPEEQAHHQKDLLARIAEWTRTGVVNVYSRQGRAAAKQEPVSLANTVFIVKWEGAPRDLVNLLNGTPELAHLADHVLGLEAMAPQHAVNDLLRRVGLDLRQHYGPQGAEVELDAGTRKSLEGAMKALGPARGLELFFEPLRRDLAEAVKEKPAKRYSITFSNRLTAMERGALEAGRPPEGVVPRWFGVKAG